jgi:hypothetical protein
MYETHYDTTLRYLSDYPYRMLPSPQQYTPTHNNGHNNAGAY